MVGHKCAGAAAHGQAAVRGAVQRSLEQAALPMLHQIALWVFQGRLQDPPRADQPEFFVAAAARSSGTAEWPIVHTTSVAVSQPV